MNLSKKNVFYAFLSTFILTLFIPVIAPSMRLMFFIPYLIILFYQKSFPYCLWAAFLCGLTIDLLSIQSPFGFYACNYTLATAVIYPQKRNFFADHLSTLPIMTVLFSVVATLLEVVFIYIFGNPISIGLQWMITDLTIMPLFDGLYAFVWFILIPLSFQKKQKRRSI